MEPTYRQEETFIFILALIVGVGGGGREKFCEEFIWKLVHVGEPDRQD